MTAIPTDPHQQAAILVQALPHMLQYDDATIVVKYGGHAMGDEAKAREFARDMVLLEQSGINPVVVHGGGPQIGAMLAKLGITSHFAGGLRITDKATVEIVEMVLAGSINKQIVGMINAEGRPRHRVVRQGRQPRDRPQGRGAPFMCRRPGWTRPSTSALSASR